MLGKKVISIPIRRQKIPCRLCPLMLGLALMAAGCNGEHGTEARTRPAGKFAGVELILGCDDARIAEIFSRSADGWCARSGAKVRCGTVDQADVAIVPPADVGRLAELGEALPLAEEIQSIDHRGQWHCILPVYRDRLAGWGGTIYAVPLAGDGWVLAVNHDRMRDSAMRQRFRERFNRPPPEFPATWEDLADLSIVCQELNQACMTAAADQALEFFQVAACYDRPALTELQRSQVESKPRDNLQFTHDLETGAPRLDAPAFAAAAAWMKQTSQRASGDSVEALSSGRAACAVMNLAQLGRLPKVNGAVAANIGIYPLPGSRVIYKSNGEVHPAVEQVDGNSVPFFAGGWFGVVRNKCGNPTAAFDLLAELSSPERSSKLISHPAHGFGPFRTEHLEQPALWQSYGFDVERNRALTEALRRYAGSPAINPAFGPRGPDAKVLMNMLVQALGTPDPLPTVQKAWQDHDAQLGSAAREYRRRSAGLR